MAKYTLEEIYDGTQNHDLHIGEFDDLEEARKEARFWTKEGKKVEIALTDDFLAGSYDAIEF